MSMKIIRDAIYRELREGGMPVREAKEIVEESVWHRDPYGWADGAKATISLENGLPNAYDSDLDFWCRVSERMGIYYVEHVNAGVAAVWDA